MNCIRDSFWRSNLVFVFIFLLGISIICLQVTRSWNNIGIECERVHEDVRMDIIEKIDKDEKFCLEEYQADIRVFQKIMNSTGEWCPFEHINVGHELTKDTSRVHACFPAAPPEMEIEIPCPNNSTAYYWDRKIKHLTRKCQKNGTWATHEGHCGCHYDIFKWDRVAFYFSGFQKFKVLLVIFSASSLVVATIILTRLNSLHCTRNTIHLHLFVACLLYNTTDLVVFIFAVAVSNKERVKLDENNNVYEPSNFHKMLCRGKDTMTIYSLLAIYSWVLIEGVYLHSLVLTAFHNGSGITKMKYFAPFGWLMPLVITIIWIVANHKYRDKESICWDSNLIEPAERWIGWIYDVPKKLLLLLATVLFFSVLRILWSKLSKNQKMTTLTANAQDRNDVSKNAPKYAQIVRASIILVIVYGIWDLKELFMHQDEFRPETIGWWIVMLIDILIDSMRGFFIASVYCFSNTEVRQEITRQYRRRCINNELRRPTRFRNNSRRSSDIRRARSFRSSRSSQTRGDTSFAMGSANDIQDGRYHAISPPPPTATTISNSTAQASSIPATTGTLSRHNSSGDSGYTSSQQNNR